MSNLKAKVISTGEIIEVTRSQYLDGRPWMDIKTQKRYTIDALEFIQDKFDIVKCEINRRLSEYLNSIHGFGVDRARLTARIDELSQLKNFIDLLEMNENLDNY